MNKIIKILLVLILLIPVLISPYSTAFAESNNLTEEDFNSCEQPSFEENEVLEKFDDYREKYANLIEKFMLDAIEILVNMFGLNTLNQLVFGNPYCVWFQEGIISKIINGVQLSFGIFPTTIYENTVEPLFELFTGSAVLLYTLAIMIMGIKLMANINQRLGEELLYFLIVAALLVGYWLGVEILLQLNHSIVTSIYSVIDSKGITPSGALNLLASKDEFTFMDIILLLANWIIVLFLNVVYIFRLFLIALYMIFGGFAIVSLLFPTTRKIFLRWLVDFSGVVFMQSFHALYFAVILLMVDTQDIPPFFELMLLILFLPISSMAMTLFSFGNSAVAVSAGQRAAVGANMVASNLSKGSNQIAKLANSSAGKIGKNASARATKISQLAKGGTGWNVLTTAAKVTGSAAGAMAGSVIGGAGMSLGSNVGGMTAGGGLQASRNVVAGVKGLMDTRGRVNSGSVDLNNIQDKRGHYSNMGESIGTFLGMGTAGRQIGEKMSGITDEMIRNTDDLGGLGGVTLQEIAATYPDAELQFRQTNEGSGFYLNNEGESSLVSPAGAADPTLKDGETRIQNYSLSNDTDGINSELYQATSQPAIQTLDGSQYNDTAFNSSAFKPEHYISSAINQSAKHDLEK